MLIVAMVSLMTVLAASQDVDTQPCDEVCEAVLVEALEWTLEQVEDLPESWGGDPDRTFLDLYLRPEIRPEKRVAREAEFTVLKGLARSRDLLAIDEGHPAWLACLEARESQGCRAGTGMVKIRVGTVEVVSPTEARVNSTISVLGSGGRGDFVTRILYMERVAGVWQVVQTVVVARS